MIEDYARNEETTWGVMRDACNLDKVRGETEIPTPHIVEEVDREARRLPELIAALAAVALDQNVDVQLNAYCLGALWGKLASQNPVRSPQGGYGVAEGYFQKMLLAKQWTPRGVPKKGGSFILPGCPNLRVAP